MNFCSFYYICEQRFYAREKGIKMENGKELFGFSRLEVLVCSVVSIAISFGPLLFLCSLGHFRGVVWLR